MEPDFDLVFENPKSYHHVKIGNGIPNITEFTIATFFKSNVTGIEGTLFSYAVGDGSDADELVITNLEALTLYVY